ncbi:MAG: hypothetical protein Q9222_007616 [Ikaeria aurantiellina]
MFSSSVAAVLHRIRSSNPFIIATLCLAFFTDDFVYGLIVPILPFALPERSGIHSENVQLWTSAMLTAYGLANLVGSRTLFLLRLRVAMLTSEAFLGRLADRWSSPKAFLLFGLLLLATATVLFGLATNAYALVTSRALQGFSTAVVYTGGFALLVNTVDRDQIGKWMGVALSSATVGLLMSPFLGSIIYGKAGFAPVFYTMLIPVILETLMRLAMTTKQRETVKEFEVQKEEMPTFTLKKRTTIVFKDEVPVETEVRPPTMFLPLLKEPRILTAVYGVFITQTLINSFDGVLAIFLHRTFGWGPIRAGLMFLPLAVPTLAAPLAGMLSDRYGPRWVAASGYALAGITSALLPLVKYHTNEHIALLCVLLPMLGMPEE